MKFFGFLAIALMIASGTSIARNQIDCVPDVVSEPNDGSPVRDRWHLMSQPPIEAQAMLALVPAPFTPVAKNPHINLWYISENGKFRFYRGQRNGAEYFDFARKDEKWVLLGSYGIVCE